MQTSNRHSGKKKVAEVFRELRPMLPTVAELPARPRQFAFEFGFDGVRTLCYHDGNKINLRGTNGIDPTNRYPELADLARFLDGQRAILDGYIVAFDQSGRPDSSRLRQRLRAEKPRFTLVEKIPVRFIVSDILFDRGRWLLDHPLEDRVKRLNRLNLNGLFWRTAERQVGQGQALLQAARRLRIPALIAKQIGSTYQPGRKSSDWIQISASNSR
jgi:bifunctional non-homologous end joining protein LigD